ncbi:hypothetical protein HETIRDRAFT_102244 [Heterobasidion irregulare TC 32-1]|uniref:Uncharacterized protein n=1 Tax=Heterobasidion irregulare (strain TC 32-1) TaxID=747525 RepID=W4KCL4_HETIT|nr:uncharacterized protein HETIRDRAFT_102244 [Heterobasidion irregulare TC 32-1]ETW83523.1 hypothetical protein HETIRDRAFT_102244 [Heterobasidion irregulare TC 32-1]
MLVSQYLFRLRDPSSTPCPCQCRHPLQACKPETSRQAISHILFFYGTIGCETSADAGPDERNKHFEPFIILEGLTFPFPTPSLSSSTPTPPLTAVSFPCAATMSAVEAFCSTNTPTPTLPDKAPSIVTV